MSTVWTEPCHWPELAGDEVHVWLAHLPSDRPNLDRYSSVLSADEHTRAGRFRFESHRERWVMTRGILRVLLARYTGDRPAQMQFDHNSHGKPFLREPALARFHFNTSHSGDHAAFAVTSLGAVGVDIETVRADMSEAEDIARRYFAPSESEQLLALPPNERSQAFFQLWTCKEAFVKARGEGLFSGLARFEVCIRDSRLLSVDSLPTTDWWMAALPDTPALAGAVVVEAGACKPRFMRWNEAFYD